MRGGNNATDRRVMLYDYVVEFEAPSGGTTRREVKQKFDTREFKVGETVPLLVRPDEKKVVFDMNDPKIKRVDEAKEHAKAEKERFRKTLEG